MYIYILHDSGYCADDGLPALKTALLEKLKVDNGIEGVQLMVTAGANQAVQHP